MVDVLAMADLNPHASFLEAALIVLRKLSRPLSSREIVDAAVKLDLIRTAGKSPHKTMNARISEDIIRNEHSLFMRTFHGQFALREWEGEFQEYKPKRRKINPINETILVLRRDKFQSILNEPGDRQSLPFHDIDLSLLLSLSEPMVRLEVEENNEFVQIISLFLIRYNDHILTYKRTKRLPEKRLHHTKSINFGGHLQDIDRAPILETFFQDDINLIFTRELHEEVRISGGIKTLSHIGCLYNPVDDFSARHVGVCFCAELNDENVESNEPGNHTTVKFETIDIILNSIAGYDEWSGLVLKKKLGEL